MLLIAGAEVNLRNDQGLTALAVAIQHGLAASVERLLRTKADPNAVSARVRALLHWLTRPITVIQLVGLNQDSLLNLALQTPDEVMTGMACSCTRFHRS